MRLPLAHERDFAEGRCPPKDANPQYLRIIDDSPLRARLILAGLAAGLQSPKGRQRIKSIIRLYPDGDAPHGTPNGARTGVTVLPSAALPTVEEIAALLSRIGEVEREVAAEMRRDTDARMTDLKRRIGMLDGDDFERAFRELGATMVEAHELAKSIRREAFHRIEADSAFEPRRFLALISRDAFNDEVGRVAAVDERRGLPSERV
jgi:hypothetical protein